MPANLIEIILTAEKPSCEVLKKLSTVNVSARIFQINPGTEDTNHLLGIENYSKNREILKDDNITVYKNQRDKTWMETKSCEICRASAISRAMIISVKIFENQKVQYKILLKDKNSLKNLQESITGIKYGYYEVDDHLPGELTLRQKEILYTAYSMGYFDFNRKIDLDGIAKELGISKKSVQATLRRGIEKIIEEYIFNNL
ncbi:MAG: helix-turn-helix domain-containing protein [Ferroplasma sp.]|uniref:helix-turn-helix domain-containing protein n=1 Tax=Ferroplasma sp. TaxID=2591003 RepID=UPI002815BB9C|nr:helix-turn-helix domain-containing protein [Ferroplasma sp.]WMT50998.1 MAG: helix-turn-helix domain-containing protein [Ferroplasma sp.]